MKRGLHGLFILALLCAMGAPVAMMQTVAWARMVVTFSHRDGFKTSLQKTFDGKHPCPLCLHIKHTASGGAALAVVPTVDGSEALLPYLDSTLHRLDLSWILPVHLSWLPEPLTLPDAPPPKDLLA